MRWIVAGLLSLSLPCVAEAQTVAPVTACSFDTAMHRRLDTLTLSLSVERVADTVPDAQLTLAIGAMIRARFRPPASIGSLFYPNVVGPKATKWVAGINESNYGVAEWTILPNGRFEAARWHFSTGDSATDQAFLDAVHEASADTIADLLAPLVKGAKVPVRAILIAGPDSSASPIVRLRVPMIHAESSPDLVHAVAPKYPLAERNTGIQASVRVQFVIDESGRAASNSIRVLSDTPRPFIDAAVAAVLAETFSPARAGFCPLKTSVTQRIRFTIGKP